MEPVDNYPFFLRKKKLKDKSAGQLIWAPE
jgi:hypothetical protein